jgi:hypothetical protein
MKKLLFSWIETFAIGGLMIAALLSTIVFFLILLYALFDVKPYIKYSSGEIGLTDFENGIPIPANIAYRFPHNNVYGEVVSSKGMTSGGSEHVLIEKRHLDSLNIQNTMYLDTFNTQYDIFYPSRDVGLTINAASIKTGTVNIETSDLGKRLLFLSPILFATLVSGYCMWQMTLLLQSITKQSPFEKINFKRLRNVGYAIILYQIVLIVLSALFHLDIDIFLFSSTLRHPISFTAHQESNFSLQWLLLGTAILILALAFKRGVELQEEQTLTI